MADDLPQYDTQLNPLTLILSVSLGSCYGCRILKLEQRINGEESSVVAQIMYSLTL